MPWTALGLTFAAGQNPYAGLFLLAVMARSEDVELSLQAPLTFLSHTAVIGVLFVLAGAQVFADKHPRWGRHEAVLSAVTRPLCAAAIVLSLLDTAAASVWLWLAIAVVIALCSHYFRMRVRRQLADKMAGMGYFLASLTLDSAALITGLFAILMPLLGFILGVIMFGGSAALPFRSVLMPHESKETDTAS